MRTRILMAALLLAASQASATVIEYTATNLSGDRWQYDYTLTNDTLGIAIDEFTVFFDVGLFGNLAVTASPASWDSIAIQPDPAIPAPGFFDSLALVAGLAVGDSLGGFSVAFDYFGSGTPGAQRWNVVDNNFQLLDEGLTVVADVTPVIEPPIYWLFLAGALTSMLIRKVQKRS